MCYVEEKKGNRIYVARACKEHKDTQNTRDIENNKNAENTLASSPGRIFSYRADWISPSALLEKKRPGDEAKNTHVAYAWYLHLVLYIA